MKTFALASLIASILIQANAEVLVYRFANTITTNGESATTSRKFGGYLVVDNDHSTVVRFTTYGKRFSVINEGLIVEKVTGLTKSYTILTVGGAYGQYFIKGQNVKVPINSKNLFVPKILTASNRGLLMEVGPSLYDSTGIGVLDTRLTAIYDSRDLTLERVIEALRFELTSKFYVEDETIR